MTGSQYQDVISKTLCQTEAINSAAVAKEILENCGAEFPSGTNEDIMLALSTDDHTGWRACSAEDAQESANMGIPTVGIRSGRVVVIKPDDEAASDVEYMPDASDLGDGEIFDTPDFYTEDVPDTSDFGTGLVQTANSISPSEQSNMQFFTHDLAQISPTMLVTACAPSPKIVVSPRNLTLRPNGAPGIITATKTPSSAIFDGWSSNNQSIAMPGGGGDIYPGKIGKATITATMRVGSTRYHDYCKVAVLPTNLSNLENTKLADTSTTSFWYRANFNNIDRGQCPWYVVGRIGEVYGARITFTNRAGSPSPGGGDGGWWLDNYNEQAFIWNNGASQATTNFRTIIPDRNSSNIEADSAACFKFFVDGKNYGHVVYIEAVELVGCTRYVYYSESVSGMSDADIGKIKKLTLTQFINKWPNFQGYIKIR